MQRIDETSRFNASDLVGYLDCHHLTTLDVAVARGDAEKQKALDPLVQILGERGLVHERALVEHLRQLGHTVIEIEGNPGSIKSGWTRRRPPCARRRIDHRSGRPPP
jgi:hypothetical protein